MTNFQPLGSAKVILYHELLGIDNLSQYRLIAVVNAVDFDKSFIELSCPESHQCDIGCRLLCSIRFATIHGFIQRGDFVEIVGTVNELPGDGEEFPKTLSVECWIMRNQNGLDFKKYKSSVYLLRQMMSTAF